MYLGMYPYPLVSSLNLIHILFHQILVLCSALLCIVYSGILVDFVLLCCIAMLVCTDWVAGSSFNQ